MRKKKRLFGCSGCGGPVRMTGGPGRTYLIRRGVELPIPDDFETPVCERCGDEYGIPEVTDKLEVVMVEVEKQLRASTPKLTGAQRTFLRSIVQAVADGERGVLVGRRQAKMVNKLAIHGLVEAVDTVKISGEFRHVYALTAAAMQALLNMSEGGEAAG